MRNVMMTIVLLAVFTASAQDRGRNFIKDLSVEEVATLKTKKLTLDLALDQSQSDKVYAIVLDQAKDRKAMMEARKSQGEKTALTKAQKVAEANERLDKRIATQNKMKQILTSTQFEEFRKMDDKHKRKGKNKRKGRKGNDRNGRE